MKTILLSLCLSTVAALAQQPFRIVTLSAHATNNIATNSLVLVDGDAVRLLSGHPAWINGLAVPTYRQGAFEKGAVSGPLFRGDVIAGPATIRVWSDASYGGTNSAFVTLERWRVLKSK